MQWLADKRRCGCRAVDRRPMRCGGYDEISEWIPALSGRHSIGTVQGSEWLGPDGFNAQLSTHAAILDCAGATLECYRLDRRRCGIFVPKGQLAGIFSPDDCCPALRETLRGLRRLRDRFRRPWERRSRCHDQLSRRDG